MNLLQLYIEAVNKRIASIGESMLGGGSSSYEDYRQQVGRVKGLREALVILQETYKSTPPEERE